MNGFLGQVPLRNNQYPDIRFQRGDSPEVVGTWWPSAVTRQLPSMVDESYPTGQPVGSIGSPAGGVPPGTSPWSSAMHPSMASRRKAMG